MTSESLNPQQWLADNPLLAGERLYAVISSTSNADPLAAYRQRGGIEPPIALWAETPYADWLPVMPYLLSLTPDSEFVQWVAQTDADDWGWLAVSTAAPELIAAHLRGLTHVLMPAGEAVFFRFWDGRHWLPILQHLGTEASDVLPMFDRYWVNGEPVAVGQGATRPAQSFPWWEVPKDLLNTLAEKDLSNVIDNLMQWLKETQTALYFSTPEPGLRQKVEHFVTLADSTQDNDNQRFMAYLQRELGQ
ncbi:DUF4123 domain-containing protein [Pseudomonas sp. CCC3.1]|uniref:DUF4123 domain-containing protein n=1 Tax=Pseudomonas sp. CCC3.1 TaxID=3048607 RepID=UPI002AC96A3D|nr:DUF4123 domain-containing protein [Pseudomonas sp. CCC3.1]MEB0207477.1 DUF4123 domain-containing protein [Pseudomonas sp. CCC3.1]WPX37828.1 DUF4123 domain-containing protein [Pseudomonas sp. CCC3.1]